MSMPATSSPMHGRVALVAGASKGIGAATAAAFADAGAAVVLAARDAAALETVAQQIRARGGQATAIPADVSDDGSVRTWSRPPWTPTAGSTPRSTTRPTGRCPRRWPTSTRRSSTAGSPPMSAAPSSG